MIDPYDGCLSDYLDPVAGDDVPARETYRCDQCGTLLAGLAQLLDHYERRHR